MQGSPSNQQAQEYKRVFLIRAKDLKEMSRRKSRASPGDIFAVPLDADGAAYGYVRTYNDPDISIIPIISEGRILCMEEITCFRSFLDAFSLRTSIKSGAWPLVGNAPFNDPEAAWPPPMKQVSTTRPDVRLVVFKGHFIPEEKFGRYDDLPEFLKLKDGDVVESIVSNRRAFKRIS